MNNAKEVFFIVLFGGWVGAVVALVIWFLVDCYKHGKEVNRERDL